MTDYAEVPHNKRPGHDGRGAVGKARWALVAEVEGLVENIWIDFQKSFFSYRVQSLDDSLKGTSFESCPARISVSVWR